MVVLRSIDGTEVSVNENDITLVAGPYPHDVGPHTYVHGRNRGVLVAAEDAAALVARLRLDPPLVKLTRPNSTPVWVNGSAVTAIRQPLLSEQRGAAGYPVNAMVTLGDLHQAVREDVNTVHQLLYAQGESIDPVDPWPRRK
jgi:hypothetical protein